jgi:tetratricopeptide (TPR) repeat protein
MRAVFRLTGFWVVGLMLTHSSALGNSARGTSTNAPEVVTEHTNVSTLASAALLDGMATPSGEAPSDASQARLERAQRLRGEGVRSGAVQELVALLKSESHEDIQRAALMELAMAAAEEGFLPRAQQILAQYIARFPQHPSIVEAYLRQGELFRRMGATSLALSKFYLVMTSALSLRVEQLEYYQRLVLRAQIEIADTHYLNSRWEEAAEFLKRLLKLDSPHLDRRSVQFKLIRTLAMQERHDQVIAQAQLFIDTFPDAPEVPEVRFMVATSLKRQGRSHEALAQVLLLLETQRANALLNPETWAYWQKRAGNEIGNQLYREGDFLGTLQIYERLAGLDDTLEWQLPVWYQIGLVYERLQQPARAGETYTNILRRGSEFASAPAPPGLKAILEMARWRRDHLTWLEKAATTAAAIRNSLPASNQPHHEPTDGDNRDPSP